MNQTLHSLAAGATGALLVAAVVVGQPALAGVDARNAAKNSVTSRSIKNGTVQAKDLNVAVNASLAKANSALQSVADGSITTAKLASGAVAGYSAAQGASQDITANSSYTTIISKALPAGNYIVNGKATLAATHSSSSQGASEQCQITDGTHTDSAQVAGALGAVFILWRHVGTASMAMPVTGPVTISLQCKNDLNAPPAGYSLGVTGARITAVQTTSNN
jgi:hypothetical protein